jgi:hypothetical protein
LEENLGAFDIGLTDQDLTLIDEIEPTGRHSGRAIRMQ